MNALKWVIQMIKNEFYEKVVYFDLSSDHGMRIAAVNIMQYLMIADKLNKNTRFGLGILRTKVQHQVGYEDLINGVMFLTRPDIAALIAHYEGYDEDTDRFVPVMPDDVLTAIQDRQYVNPVSGKNLTKEEFSEQIQISFSPSKGLLKSIQ